jgi:hypothetical protein
MNPDLPEGHHAPPNHIVGSWRVQTVGAPYPDHVMVFHADGTFLIHNPTDVQENPNDAGGGTHDSVGVGAWEFHGHQVIGTFLELNAFVNNGQPAPDIMVTFKLELSTSDHFAGPAIDSAGRHVTLFGTRVSVDRELAAELVIK